ncbi:UDP-N-acetylmuramoyl-tripeptide--D-alanyl-D-alanine ligase [Bacilli bacterium PM5-3]|nr:UDP-N-acetylmuramoyl-tripeptide--D-alanyl-D-alanine ligase [Bacilli bacterium PM5-3]MDH6604301.1 UDP-N-acetylmuramoyl-tripeptide--D-alanyl-D-alanine ligase [Bacilli bacterium PM5-9]
MINSILLLALFVVYTIFISISAKKALHMFQQNRYEIVRFRQWQKANVTKTYPLYVMVSWFLIALLSLIISSYEIRLFIIITVLIIQGINLLNKNKIITVIKPLVYTNRVKRQIFTYTILYLLFVIGCYQIKDNYFLLILLLFVYNLYQMHIISLVSLINYPLENFFKQRFMNTAKKKLRENKTITSIGITGSYGKTSSKNIINEVLAKKYYCLVTPASYNTPLGISITLNNSLQAIHEIFICEMGADKVGEISELVNFVQPEIGVVTSIGQQHLATFKTQENIINEKMQMVELMPESGVVVLNKDEKFIREYNITSKAKQIWYGVEEDADIKASDISYSKDGSKFKVSIDNEVYDFETKLLGLHNIYNILAAIAIARHFDISIKELQIAIKQLNYVKNRLEIKKQKDYTVIDNAFNSNPVSSKMSLDVLSYMPGTRICITPGMIDLGDKQDYYNKEFGKYFKTRCDKVILVGRKQTKAIYEGLEESGFEMKNVHTVTKIYDAYNLLAKIKEPDCYVLFENDLPDAFNI